MCTDFYYKCSKVSAEYVWVRASQLFWQYASDRAKETQIVAGKVIRNAVQKAHFVRFEKEKKLIETFMSSVVQQ